MKMSTKLVSNKMDMKQCKFNFNFLLLLKLKLVAYKNVKFIFKKVSSINKRLNNLLNALLN